MGNSQFAPRTTRTYTKHTPVNRRNDAWAFARGEAFRTIASLELLGALVSVMVLLPESEVVSATSGLVTLTCGTDNQDNSYLIATAHSARPVI